MEAKVHVGTPGVSRSECTHKRRDQTCSGCIKKQRRVHRKTCASIAAQEGIGPRPLPSWALSRPDESPDAPTWALPKHSSDAPAPVLPKPSSDAQAWTLPKTEESSEPPAETPLHCLQPWALSQLEESSDAPAESPLLCLQLISATYFDRQLFSAVAVCGDTPPSPLPSILRPPGSPMQDMEELVSPNLGRR